MAVFDIIPDKNVRAVDIRDTLLANGADWSNERVKNANYLPNYFKKGAKINPYSKRKPTECGDILHYATNEDFKRVQYGIYFKKYRYADREQLYNDYINGLCELNYDEPKIKRMSDFCGYYPRAVNPVFVDIREEIVTQGETQFEVDTAGGTDHNVGFYEIYPPEFRHLGLRVSFENKVFWTTAPIDWDNIDVPKPSTTTEGEIFEFMCDREFLSTENTDNSDVNMMPIIVGGNPHKVKFITNFGDPLIIEAYVTWYGDRPNIIRPEEEYRVRYEVKFINNKNIEYHLPKAYVAWVLGSDVVGTSYLFGVEGTVLSKSGTEGSSKTFEGDFFVKGDPRNYMYEFRCDGYIDQVELDDGDDDDEN